MKVLLDGHGVKLLAIRGKPLPPDVHDPPGEEAMSEIVIETDIGNYVISGCHACSSVFFERDKRGD